MVIATKPSEQARVREQVADEGEPICATSRRRTKEGETRLFRSAEQERGQKSVAEQLKAEYRAKLRGWARGGREDIRAQHLGHDGLDL